MNTLFYMHISIYKVYLNQWLKRIMHNMNDRHPILQMYTFSWFLNVTVQWHHPFLHCVVHWYNIFDWKTVWHSCFSPTWDSLTISYSLFNFTAISSAKLRENSTKLSLHECMAENAFSVKDPVTVDRSLLVGCSLGWRTQLLPYLLYWKSHCVVWQLNLLNHYLVICMLWK